MMRPTGALLLLGVACQPTVSIGTNAGSGTGVPATTSTGTDAPLETSAAASSESSSSSSAAASETSGGGGGSTSAGSLATSDDGDLPYACLHVPFESDCVACAKQACCTGFDQCAADFGCGCVLGCLQYPPPMGCPCPPNDTAQELFACLSSGCDAECPP